MIQAPRSSPPLLLFLTGLCFGILTGISIGAILTERMVGVSSSASTSSPKNLGPTIVCSGDETGVTCREEVSP